MKTSDRKNFIRVVRADLDLHPDVPTDDEIMETTKGSFYAAKINLKIAWAGLVTSVKRSFKKTGKM